VTVSFSRKTLLHAGNCIIETFIGNTQATQTEGITFKKSNSYKETI